MIAIENLEKSFTHKKILNEISLTINKGEIYGIVGESGSGKSTLLRCLNGIENYEGGSIKINNKEVKQLSKGELQAFRKTIGMIFQDFTLLSRKNIFENIALPMKCWRYSKVEIAEKVNQLLKIVGLEKYKEAMPSQLSGGQKQRVAIARALTMNPELLLCDEATSALDPKTTNEILQLLNDINQKLGITMVIVTHQIDVIKQVCHKMALMEAGTIVDEGEVIQLFFEERPALRDLLDNDSKNQLRRHGCYFKLLVKNQTIHSFFYQLGEAVSLPYSLLSSEITKYRNQLFGSFLIEIDEKQVRKFKEYFDQIDCKYQLIQEEITE